MPIGTGQARPGDEAMEKALLGAMLSDQRVAEMAVSSLKSGDLLNTQHQLVFISVESLLKQRQPVDATLVAAEMERLAPGVIKDSADYLASVMNGAAPENGEAYLGRVLDHAMLAQMQDACLDFAQSCTAPGATPETMLATLGTAVKDAAARRLSSELVPFRPLVEKVFQDIVNGVELGTPTNGIPTGFSGLDDITTGLQRQDLVLVAARPSVGKTAYSLNVALNAALCGYPVVFFSLEMSKEALTTRILQREARIDSKLIRSRRLSQTHIASLVSAIQRIQHIPLWVDDLPRQSAVAMRAKVQQLQRRVPLGMVVVDYLQLMKSGHHTDNRVDEVREIAQGLKDMARDLNVPVLALAQLSRAVEKREDKTPLLSDLGESGHLERVSDVIMFLHRDGYGKYRQTTDTDDEDGDRPVPDPTDLIVAKHRNGETASVPLVFYKRWGLFEERTDIYE